MAKKTERTRRGWITAIAIEAAAGSLTSFALHKWAQPETQVPLAAHAFAGVGMVIAVDALFYAVSVVPDKGDPPLVGN